MAPRRSRSALAALVGGAMLVAAPAAAFAAEAIPLAAHRAAYDLTLDKVHGDDVAGVHGDMTYEMEDSCDGWATQQRLTLHLTNRDGQDIEMVTDYATWESKDGLRMRFHMRQTTDTAVTEQMDGESSLDGAGQGGTVRYTQPEEKEVPLPPGTLFPTAHTAAILAAAVAGQKFVALPIFDGTSSQGAQDSSILIQNWNPPGPAPYPPLAELPSGRVHIAFFKRGGGDQSPDYEVGMRYWLNGVADDLGMDFGSFVMRGRLKEFDLRPPHC
jgi:hypothetical protein